MAFDEALAKRVRKMLDGRADLVEKHMFGGVCFMIRGRMMCGIVDSSLMVRLASDEAERLADEAHVRSMDFTGKPMRGFSSSMPKGSIHRVRCARGLTVRLRSSRRCRCNRRRTRSDPQPGRGPADVPAR